MRYLILAPLILSGCTVITWGHPVNSRAELKQDLAQCQASHGGSTMVARDTNKAFRQCMADKGYVAVEEII